VLIVKRRDHNVLAHLTRLCGDSPKLRTDSALDFTFLKPKVIQFVGNVETSDRWPEFTIVIAQLSECIEATIDLQSQPPLRIERVLIIPRIVPYQSEPCP